MRNSLEKSIFLQILRVQNAAKMTKQILRELFFRNNFVSEGMLFCLYHWGQNYYIPFLCFGELLLETLQHDILGEINYCNATIGAVLPWKERIFRLQLHFSFRAMWELITVM